MAHVHLVLREISILNIETAALLFCWPMAALDSVTGITWKERHLPEINSEALNNYFYTFLNIADCLQLLFIYYSDHYSLDGIYSGANSDRL